MDMSKAIKALVDFIDEQQFHISGDDVVLNWPSLRQHIDILRAVLDSQPAAAGGFRVKGAFFTVDGREWHRRDQVVTVTAMESGETCIVIVNEGFTRTLITDTPLAGVLEALS
jgi:hypothetical protein